MSRNDRLWNQVALNLPKRTNKDCRKRWMKLGAHLKKGSWTNEEDQQLKIAVDKVGCNWTLVAGILKSRHAERVTRAMDGRGTLSKKKYSLKGLPPILKIAPKSEKIGILPTSNSKPILTEPERITHGWSCPEEKVNRERNQNGYLDISAQPYTNTPNEGSQQTPMTPVLFYGHTRTASTSVESDCNNINDACWQKTQGDIGGGSMKPPASSGVNHSPILAALLHQMRNQANLPPLFWLDNYFPMSDPLWGGILTFEQTQVKEPSSFLPENQGLGQPYLGFPGDDPAEYTRGDIFWHGSQK
ncbi:hypothetical protein V500_05275 [Pseudogymnoascus sp. VKM F-4518 (FW-2643)]|nr:hypothetical protein V500_05275 [Pseudogymnoascus sp. VKM F-4518 (FW-2643)]